MQKNFTSKRSMKQHMWTQHKSNFKYSCEQHNWHSDNKALDKNHMVTNHGADKEGPVSSYKCKKCKKVLQGNNYWPITYIEACNIPKNFQCTICKRHFKTRVYLVSVHMKEQHTQTVMKFTCHKCNKIVSSKQAMINHQGWHCSLEILVQSRRMRLTKNGTRCCCTGERQAGIKVNPSQDNVPSISKKKEQNLRFF